MSQIENNKKDKEETDKFIKITSTGIVDFDIIVSLTELEADQMMLYPEKIESISDLKKFFMPINIDTEQMTFQTELQRKGNIYDFIKLTSNNKTINSLLFVNRAFKKKAFIEYVTMTELKFREGEEFLKEVVKNITEQNFLFLVENEFLNNLNSKISLVIKIENKVVKKFDNICQVSENPSDKEKNSNNEENNNDIDSIKEISRMTENDEENAEGNAEGKSNKTKSNLNDSERKSNLTKSQNKTENNSAVKTNNNNAEENNNNKSATKSNDGNNNNAEENKENNAEGEKTDRKSETNKSKLSNNEENNQENLIEDLNNENNNNISKSNINNNNNSQKDENENEEDEKPKEPIFDRFKYDFNGTDYFFVDINEIFELKLNGFTIPDFYELVKKIAEDFKKISIIINFPNIIKNIGYLDLESINVLNEIISLTDIFIFDKKDALALFNLMAQINSEEDNYEDKKNLEHLFIKEIKKKRKNHPKIGIFLDDLKQVTIIEQSSSNLILYHTDFDFNLIPPNISKNVNSDYKKLFVVHYEYLKSVFIGGLFSRILYKKPFNSGFVAGNDSLKRVIELLRFDLDFPADPNFFLIKIKKNKDKEKPEKEEEKIKKKKEQHFIIDSTNVINSKMNEYNPLYDNNLVSYFSSKYIRKHLKNLGFINKKGSILEDPDSKKLGIIESKKLNRAYEEEKVNLQKIKDRKEKMKLQIKNLLQGNQLMKNGNMKEIEKLARVYNFNPKSDKKLPSVNDYKKSINKNIKLNSQIYLNEIQKGKKTRFTSSNNKSISKTNNNQKSAKSNANANTKDQGKNLLDVIEKIEDKILYDTTEKFPKNNEVNINIDQMENIEMDNNNNMEENINNENNLNENLDVNNMENENNENNNIENNENDNNVMSTEKKIENSVLEKSNDKSKVLSSKSLKSKNKDNLEEAMESVQSEKNLETKKSNNLEEDLISKENMEVNMDDNNNNDNNSEKEKKLNFEESKIENKSVKENEENAENNNNNDDLVEKSVGNLSKISKRNEDSVDLNASKKSISPNTEANNNENADNNMENNAENNNEENAENNKETNNNENANENMENNNEENNNEENNTNAKETNNNENNMEEN